MQLFSQTFEVITSEKPTNVAYSTDKLNFHMDLLFYESAPGLQLLHCIRSVRLLAFLLADTAWRSGIFTQCTMQYSCGSHMHLSKESFEAEGVCNETLKTFKLRILNGLGFERSWAL